MVNYRLLLLILAFTACATTKTDYRKIVNNSTFSDVHRNPKVVESEYFEFKNNRFTYTEVRKKFSASYFKKESYRGTYAIAKDSLFLIVSEMLYCDKEVLGMNQHPRPKRGEPTRDPDDCSYSFYTLELLRSRSLIDKKSVALPSRFRIVKNASTTKIVALDKAKGKVYEAKEPLIY
ncbi:MAG: hypothetical protein AB8G22_00460 [Saprospiraceae bacterium]